MNATRPGHLSIVALLIPLFLTLACKESSDPLTENVWKMVQTIDKDGNERMMDEGQQPIYHFKKDGAVKFTVNPDQTLYWKMNEGSNTIEVYETEKKKEIEEEWKILSLDHDTMRMNPGAEVEYVLVSVDGTIDEVAPELK